MVTLGDSVTLWTYILLNVQYTVYNILRLYYADLHGKLPYAEM